MKPLFFLVICCFLFSCDRNNDDPQDPTIEEYFPPSDNAAWATISPDSLGWNISELDALYTLLEDNNTRAFIVLQDGKVAIEKYWGKKITTLGDFDENSVWYWASAGKTITASVTGIAEGEGFLSLDDPTSKHLGKWTSMAEEKENLITIEHQLTMTTGVDFTVGNIDCTLPECLEYRMDAGEQWYYHNATYTLLQSVITNAVNQDFESYTEEKLLNPLGIDGTWNASGYNHVFYTNAMDAARFGLMILRKGKWEENQIIPEDYYNSMINTSQELNPSYGYLWWLNGKSSIRYPSLDLSINASLSEEAPGDMFAALGKNGQFIDVVPSKNMVVIRMGEVPESSLVPIIFHNDMWKLINNIIE